MKYEKMRKKFTQDLIADGLHSFCHPPVVVHHHHLSIDHYINTYILIYTYTPTTAMTKALPEESTLLIPTARDAFKLADVEASRLYHDVKSANEDGHQSEGGLIKPIIFGGLDGILTSFAIVAGAAGGKLSPQVVMILGFSNIFADALSMGVGEFLSSKANNEWILSERQREEWELENYPEGEMKEMIEIYEEKGMTPEDARAVITVMAKYKDFFVDLMMAQELDLMVPTGDYMTESIKEGMIMFASFAFFGALPLLGYVIFPIIFPYWSSDALFRSACCVTACVLFLMGSVKSLVSAQHWFRAGLETLLLGGACATVAFTIGQLVERWASDDSLPTSNKVP
jgi:VIT1/CCC1 family predicted Fe2+/Mn2+ transporter